MPRIHMAAQADGGDAEEEESLSSGKFGRSECGGGVGGGGGGMHCAPDRAAADEASTPR